MFGGQVNRSNASRRTLIKAGAAGVSGFLLSPIPSASRAQQENMQNTDVPKKLFEQIAAKDKHLVWLGDRVQFQFYEDPETIDLAVSSVSEWFDRHV